MIQINAKYLRIGSTIFFCTFMETCKVHGIASIVIGTIYRKTMRQILLTLLIVGLFIIDSLSQSNDRLYIPVTINSPLFNQSNEIQIGATINNYGLNYNLAGQFENKIIILSIQQNTGSIEFDPLNFNDYYEQGEETHLIQSKPSNMLYGEIGLGYNFKHKSQKISLIAGVGQQFQNLNTRYFIQIDWGNESRLINAGVSLRANYSNVDNRDLVTLEPIVQGKVKIWNFRIVNQFGYSIAIKRNEDYMKPILTVGIEYIIENSANKAGSKTSRQKVEK